MPCTFCEWISVLVYIYIYIYIGLFPKEVLNSNFLIFSPSNSSNFSNNVFPKNSICGIYNEFYLICCHNAKIHQENIN